MSSRQNLYICNRKMLYLHQLDLLYLSLKCQLNSIMVTGLVVYLSVGESVVHACVRLTNVLVEPYGITCSR